MPNFEIIVPVGSEPPVLVSWAVRGWASLGMSPLFVVDSKFSEHSVERLERAGAERITIYENQGHYLEAGYENLCHQSDHDWIFRVDLDELPLSWNGGQVIEEHIKTFPGDIGGVMRNELFWSRNRLWSVDDPRWGASTYLQRRLFNQTEVAWDKSIHTAGFLDPEEARVRDLGPNLKLSHFNWVFRSVREIKEKTALYDSCGQREINRMQQQFDYLLHGKRRWHDRGLERAVRLHRRAN